MERFAASIAHNTLSFKRHKTFCSSDSSKSNECDSCEAKFPSQDALKVHLEKNHITNSEEFKKTLQSQDLDPEVQLKELRVVLERLPPDVLLKHQHEETTLSTEIADNDVNVVLDVIDLSADGFSCPLCQGKLDNVETRQKHLLEEHNMFPCPECLAYFKTEDLLTTHCRLGHGLTTVHQCPLCPYKSFVRSITLDHIKGAPHHKMVCTHCKDFVWFNTDKGLAKHFQEKHRESASSKLSCKRKCGLQFYTEAGLKNHMERHSGEEGYDGSVACVLCLIVLQSKEAWIKHSYDCHQMYGCRKCCNIFKSYDDLKSHFLDGKEHHQKHPCPICNINCISWQDRTCHLWAEHYQIACNSCFDYFPTSGLLQNHKASCHKGSACPLCKTVCSSRMSLYDHLYHNHDKLMCQLCDDIVVFSNAQDCTDHYSKDHPKKTALVKPRQNIPGPEPSSFNCSKCKKVFSSRVTLACHYEVVHNKYEGLHKCQMCGFMFENDKSLLEHKKTHEVRTAVQVQDHPPEPEQEQVTTMRNLEADITANPVIPTEAQSKPVLPTSLTKTSKCVDKQEPKNLPQNPEQPIRPRKRNPLRQIRKNATSVSESQTIPKEKTEPVPGPSRPKRNARKRQKMEVVIIPIMAEPTPIVIRRFKIQCKVCWKHCNDKDDLKGHTLSVHGEHMCTICDKTFGADNLLKMHLTLVHDADIETKPDPDNQDIVTLTDDDEEADEKVQTIDPSESKSYEDFINALDSEKPLKNEFEFDLDMLQSCDDTSLLNN